MSFFSLLADRARTVDSLLCIGLDPHPDLVGSATADAARDWCLRLVDAAAPVACAFKPNAAFFEALGAAGWTTLKHVIQAARQQAPVVLDAKRGDIASTAQAYARSVFDLLEADAVTLSPYLGRDSVEPFLAGADHGVFLLCKTSNPGSEDLQALPMGSGEPLYLRVARLASTWNTRDNVGLVVGATDAAALAQVREIVPDMWILAPGVGEQGGSLEAALRVGLRPDGLGLLVPVSRQIARATDPAAEARRLCDQIRRGQASPRPRRPADEPRARLAQALIDAGCIRFGDFTLKSGLRSPLYLDLRLLASHPTVLRQAAAAYQGVLDGLVFDRLAAIPHAAMAIGTAIALASGKPMIYPRLDVKDYGRQRGVEGEFVSGQTAVVIDDLATTGGSKFEAVERLRQAGLRVADIVVLIDRQSGASEALAAQGLRLHAVFTLEQLLELWEQSGGIRPDQALEVRDFLARRT
jgi:uridine monophosphate synthetase